MIRLSISIVAAALTIGMVAGCVREAKEVEIYTDLEQVINIGTSEEFIIALDSGFVFFVDEDHGVATGFDWRTNYDVNMLRLVDSRFEPSKENELEASGTKWFKFKALKTGETEITMVYTRTHWLPNTLYSFWKQLDKKIFTINIK